MPPLQWPTFTPPFTLGLSGNPTVGAGRSDDPGMEGKVFKGISPGVRNDAQLPSLDEKYGADRLIKSPFENSAFTRHAEEDIFNDFIMRVDDLGLSKADLNGRTFSILIDNSKGVCNKCYAGIPGLSQSSKNGVVKQFSEHYPGLTLKISVTEGADAVTGKLKDLVIKNGVMVGG